MADAHHVLAIIVAFDSGDLFLGNQRVAMNSNEIRGELSA
jgi:hypothetical protein